MHDLLETHAQSLHNITGSSKAPGKQVLGIFVLDFLGAGHPSEGENTDWPQSSSVHQVLPRRDVGSCQNYGPFLGPYYSTAPNI